MEKDTTGAKVRENRANGKLAETSTIYLKNVAPPTSSTEQNTLDVKLEILYQSLRNYIEAGGKARLMDMRPLFESVAIVLDGVATEPTLTKQNEVL
jgi:hypothetical protein